ncbi:MAG: hypothetical protein J07HN6_01746 [Halonotius sp. J07HN6]|nr:MAG: hypothetical protein J07HN6_01746 [Halonotius sp. J07HN6]ERH05611.1 MAG: hypothetical protein J07HN4v3_01214 [Halonotius sp. J07HN4]
MPDTALTLDRLRTAGLDEQFTALRGAVTNGLDSNESNIAVVAEPFACRDRLLDHIEREFPSRTGRVSISDAASDTLPPFPDTDIVLVDDCQLLYQRDIGGFDTLDVFIEEMASRETVFVTAWNRYAWSYLTAVTALGSLFPDPISIPRLKASQVSELLQSYHDNEQPDFREVDDTQRVKTLDIDVESTTVAGVSVPTPAVRVNREYILPQSRTDEETDIEAVVYQTIATLSAGAPRVAVDLWERSIRDGTIAPAYVKEVDESLDINRDTAFVLELVLTNEAIASETIAAICRDSTPEQAIQTLRTNNLVTVDGDGTVRLEPTRLRSTITHLQRRQLVW